ncbi:MAG: ADOP family duplicated permease [Vicinamibacteraceae bacterium]
MPDPLTALMRAARVARLRLRSLVAGRRVDAEVDDELAFHAAMVEDEARARGLSAADARLEARRRLDGAALRRDECRDARGFAWLDAVRQDVRHALRGLRRTPVYTAIALASLGVGLGAAAALFAIVDAVLVRPLPLPDAGRVVWIAEQRNGVESSGSPQRLADWQRLGSIGAAGGYYGDEPFVRTATADLGRLPAVRTFGRFFDVLGLAPIVGRLPTAAELRADGPAVVLLAERAWRTRFAAGDVVGQILRVDRGQAEIIGVLPDAAESVTAADMWMPAPPHLQATSRNASFLGQIARLSPAGSLDGARAELDAAARTLAIAYPVTDRGLQARIVPLHVYLGRDARTPLLLLLATVGAVLLVVCLNVASLALARGLGRLRDASLRVAIGASRARLLQLHLLESGLLAAGGAVLGGAIAWFGVDALRAWLPEMPGLARAALDLRVLFAMAGVAVACSLIVGALPVLIAWRAAAAPTLREGGAAVSGLARSRARGALVVTQVAVAVVLLVGAGLLSAALGSLGSTPGGYDHPDALTFRVPLPWDSDESRIAEVTVRVLERLQSTPGVRAAGVADRLPFGGGSQTSRVAIDGVALPTDLAERKVAWRTASDGFFKAIGVPLRSGEDYPERWTSGAPRVALINERFARLYLGGRNPIGLELGEVRSGKTGEPRYRIVGVVGDLRTAIDEASPMPAVYVPPGATFWPILHFAVRADGDPSQLLPVVRAIAGELAPDIAVEAVEPLGAQRATSLREPRMRTAVASGFAAVTLLLAAIGLYGLLAGEVAARVKEIGIKLALGAAPRQMLRETMDRGLRLAGLGVVLGLSVSPLVARAVERVIGDRPGTTSWTPFAAALVLALAMALASSVVPAWRAARIDPNRALRTD